MPTLGDMVEQVRGHLNQYVVNRPATATFESWVLDGSNNKIGLKLKDVSSGDLLVNVLVELSTGELVHVSSYDPSSKVATCPVWFRAQLGTVLNDTVAANSRVVVEPLWPTHHIALKLVDGIHNLYPDLFAVKEVNPPLSSSAVNGNYVLPADVDGILNIAFESVGPSRFQQKPWEWTLDISNVDGLRYLRMYPSVMAGRPIYVTYRAKPVVPAATNLSATWASTLLPESAVDLPVLYAVFTMLPATEAAKTQVHSVEQSDRNRFVQAGSATAASRRYQDMYLSRLTTERRKLVDRFPPRMYKTMNG